MNLFSYPVLETALSVIVCWGLFSLLCSYLHEAIAQIKAERGRFMKHYLLKQFQDLPNGVNWASMLYLHGSVDMLSRAFNKPTNEISPEVFAKTMVEVVGNAHLVRIQKEPIDNQSAIYQNTSLRNFRKAVDCLSPSDVMSLFEQSIKDADIRGRYQGILDEAAVYSLLVSNIETWYVNFTERVSYWYRKRTKRRLFILGFLVAMVLNVDSIELFRHFNINSSSRSQILEYYLNHQTALEQEALKITESENITSARIININKQISLTANKLDSIGNVAALPVSLDNNYYSYLKSSENDISGKMLKLLGFLLSGFAVSFGAPFWFDVLKKLYSFKK